MCIDLLVFNRAEVTLCGRQDEKNPVTTYLLSGLQNCVCKFMHLIRYILGKKQQIILNYSRILLLQ